MSRRNRVISSLLLAAALVAVIGLSEAELQPPEYADSFCLLDQGHRMCGFRTLALCIKNMAGAASECVRESAKDNNADDKSRGEH